MDYNTLNVENCIWHCWLFIMIINRNSMLYHVENHLAEKKEIIFISIWKNHILPPGLNIKFNNFEKKFI